MIGETTERKAGWRWIPGFCVMRCKDYENTCSKRGETRRGLIQTSVKQKNHLSYSQLIAAYCSSIAGALFLGSCIVRLQPPSRTRSIGFCVIWVNICPSSSSNFDRGGNLIWILDNLNQKPTPEMHASSLLDPPNYRAHGAPSPAVPPVAGGVRGWSKPSR